MAIDNVRRVSTGICHSIGEDVHGRGVRIGIKIYVSVGSYGLYGKKLWLLYPVGTKLKTRNLTSMELLEMMVNDYMGQSDFEMPQMCIVEEGDVAYIPSHLVHMSYNIETTSMVGCVFYP